MKCIIAEKPSVAREIARIVGANKQENGYLKGESYYVTWALGHLVAPALPDGYGIKGFHKENLPIIPPVFTLVPRQVKTEKGYKADRAIVAHIKIIAELFKKSEKIIVATDAGREGELIFRYLYEYIGCATPFDRLWISSLTDKAIRKGLDELQSGSHYDNLYYAAKARSEADWLVGINATQAITVAAGRGLYSIGRVQTPTLAILCERFWEHRKFKPEDVYQLHFSVKGEGEEVVKFHSLEKWNNKSIAEGIYAGMNPKAQVLITKVECKEKTEQAPLLYDLTTLQKEANTKHGFSADKTLSLAQKLYEAKLISYPRTGSRYIPKDVFEEIPALLLSLKGSKWGAYLKDLSQLSTHSVDDTKITDHHALLITGEKPNNLSSEEASIYHLIIGRMLEAFSQPCIKDITTMEALADNVPFACKGTIIKQKGWRAIYDESTEDTLLPSWEEGEELPLMGFSLTSGKTKPKPLHTEASLLSAMETAGKEIEDEELRQSLKDCGIGTPATRASIIETLFKREYITRQKKALVPTEKGLALHSIVKVMSLANVQMTGEWENALAKIEKGELSCDVFRRKIESYTSEVVSQLLTSEILYNAKESKIRCPKCQQGTMQFYDKVVRCNNADCGLPIFRLKAGKILDEESIKSLITKGKTEVIGGFKSKANKSFSAQITFDADFNTLFVFPETKKRK